MFLAMQRRQQAQDRRQRLAREDFSPEEHSREDQLSREEQSAVDFFQRLKRVCKQFTGVHDFSSFVDRGLPTKCIREVVTYRASGSLQREGEGGEVFVTLSLLLDKRAPGLLERLVGTTIAVMRGDLPPETIRTTLLPTPLSLSAPVSEEEVEKEEGTAPISLSRDTTRKSVAVKVAEGVTEPPVKSERGSKKTRQHQKAQKRRPQLQQTVGVAGPKGDGEEQVESSRLPLVVNLPRAPTEGMYISKVRRRGESPCRNAFVFIHLAVYWSDRFECVSLKSQNTLPKYFVRSCTRMVQKSLTMKLSPHTVRSFARPRWGKVAALPVLVLVLVLASGRRMLPS